MGMRREEADRGRRAKEERGTRGGGDERQTKSQSRNTRCESGWTRCGVYHRTAYDRLRVYSLRDCVGTSPVAIPDVTTEADSSASASDCVGWCGISVSVTTTVVPVCAFVVVVCLM